jgi:hypothetical protein
MLIKKFFKNFLKKKKKKKKNERRGCATACACSIIHASGPGACDTRYFNCGSNLGV